MIRVFISTKLTQSADDRSVSSLLPRLGVGCVTQDAREFYFGGTPDNEVAERLHEWFEWLGNDEIETVSADPSTDWPRVEHLLLSLGSWPKNLRRDCSAIAFENAVQQQLFDASLVEFWQLPVHDKHRDFALMKARSLVYGWWHAHANTMSAAEFSAVLEGIMQLGLNDGDIGYAYWWGVRLKLKELRSTRGG